MENLNSCCFVSKIDLITPIEGADNIELALIGGWNCLVKKNQYTIGDLVVIATQDAVIPETISSNMGVTNYLRGGSRVKTVKLRGVYSECLIIADIANNVTHFDKSQLQLGQDMTDKLGIYKYEPPVKMVQLSSGRKMKWSDNPNFHIYYKFPNIKNVPDMYSEEDIVQITRKIHGTNARYGIVKKTKLSLWDKVKKFFKLSNEWSDYDFIVGSHNVEKGSDSQGFYDTNVWYEISDKYNVKEKLWKFTKDLGKTEIGTGLVIYGEIWGKGIQKGYDYGMEDIKFSGFDVTQNGKYLTTLETKLILESIDLDHVEELYIGNWSKEVQDNLVFKNFIKGTKVPHEGIVIKSISGSRDKVAKVINPDYLIYAENKDIGDSH